MQRLVNIPYREEINISNYRNLSHSKVDVYGVRINFYSKNSNLIRFIKRKFSLMQYYKLNDRRYKLLNKKIDVILNTKEQAPSREELAYINNDTNGLIAEALSNKCIFFHASCIASDENYLLFLGVSRSGKSTIATCLKNRGFTLLADDDSVLEYNSLKALPFPCFGNLRTMTAFLNKFVKRDGNINNYIYNAPDSEFKEIYDLGIRLYENKFSDIKKKKRNFIFIKGRINGKPSLEAADKTDPETIKLFFRFIKTSGEKRNDKILEIMDLYTKSNMYFLIMGTPEDTAGLILEKFQ